MLIYNRTACPSCGALNNMYRPLDFVKKSIVWDSVKCWQCYHEYRHTDKINNVTTEAEQVKREGRV